MLTNRLPFTGDNEMAVIHAIFNLIPPPPSAIISGIDPAWDKLVMTCLSKQPSERPAGVGEVIEFVTRLSG